MAVAALTPFVDKAFTIDDPMFLRQAALLLNDPWHPTAFEYVWAGNSQRMSSIM